MLSFETPHDWPDSDLGQFAETMFHNTLANFHNEKEVRQKLEEVSDIFDAAFTGLSNPKHQLSALLGIRCLGAFKVAAILAMSAPIEAYSVMRSCLEYAGYSYLISKRPDLESVWLRRDVSAATEKKMRDSFTNGYVKQVIKEENARISELYGILYENIIRNGAHPNEKALTASMQVRDDKENERLVLDVILIPKGGISQLESMRICVRTGLIALYIFRLIAPEQFAQLDARISAVSLSL